MKARSQHDRNQERTRRLTFSHLTMVPCAIPRSIDDLFRIMASSMSYPAAVSSLHETRSWHWLGSRKSGGASISQRPRRECGKATRVTVSPGCTPRWQVKSWAQRLPHTHNPAACLRSDVEGLCCPSALVKASTATKHQQASWTAATLCALGSAHRCRRARRRWRWCRWGTRPWHTCRSCWCARWASAACAAGTASHPSCAATPAHGPPA